MSKTNSYAFLCKGILVQDVPVIDGVKSSQVFAKEEGQLFYLHEYTDERVVSFHGDLLKLYEKLSGSYEEALDPDTHITMLSETKTKESIEKLRKTIQIKKLREEMKAKKAEIQQLMAPKTKRPKKANPTSEPVADESE